MQNGLYVSKGFWVAGIISLFAFSSCNDRWNEDVSMGHGPELILSGKISQQNESRANDNGFVDGDRMGVYIVDYENGKAGVLSATDNRASNILYTFDASDYGWKSATTLYWKDKTTPVDVYGYYPGVNYIDNPSAYEFEVSEKQNILPQEGEISNYEASDFLWGKVTKVSPTTEAITIAYKHRMAGVLVNLKMGDNFTATEWEKIGKQLQVDNTIRTATVDLTDGTPKANGSVDKSIQMLEQSDDVYRAVVVPQTVAASKPLITLTIDGYTYVHSLATPMVYQSGKLHNFTIKVNKSTAGSGYELRFSYEGITEWINDETSHNFVTNQYVVIHCPTPGTLKECIEKAGYNYQEMENLKVAGLMTGNDFEFINKQMSQLKHLNLKSVEVKSVLIYDKSVETHKNHWEWFSRRMDNAIPKDAFYQNKNLRSIILPQKITHIGDNSFRESHLMYSTLEIPEGVTFIGDCAFSNNGYNGMEVILPLSLDTICNRAFEDCAYKCNLTLSDNIRYVGERAFGTGGYPGCLNFYGTFQIPSKLTTLSSGSFSSLGSNGSMDGGIEIPQGVKEIPERAFSLCAGGWNSTSFKNRITLNIPNGVKKIGKQAFASLRFNSLHFNDDLEEIGYETFWRANIPFQIVLPSRLRVIDYRAFCEARVEGMLEIPESCEILGEGAFMGNNLTKVTLPQRLEIIPKECFSNNRTLQEITIHKYVNYIGNNAFDNAAALQTLICLNPEPPILGNNVFNGVSMDKAILQVPEQSVGIYRNASGWSQFKNITAYHELAFNIPEIKTLDKGLVRKGILRSEGEWEVAECPSWVKVSPTSGSAKAEITVTVEGQSQGAGNREGNIVFRLKENNYTTYTTVKQFSSYNSVEDKTIVLQKASAVAAREVPLFIVGDGYDAEEIQSGQYMQDMKAQMEHFFSIEPYKTYRDYFTVSTSVVCSPESGVNGVTKFESENHDGLYGNAELAWQYALKYGEGFSTDREADCTIMVLLNTSSTANYTEIADNGRTVSWVGKSSESYPFDQKSQVLREVGGVAFGKLATEGIGHFTFIQACSCPCCNMLSVYQKMRSKGWFMNASLSNKMNDVPWYHYIFHEKYARLVDVYEGAYQHARGIYRSENVSIMGNTYIPYFNTISREAIVRRIMECAGKEFSLDEFIENDKIEIPE